MATEPLPQFYTHRFTPITINDGELRACQNELQNAIANSVKVIEAEYPPPAADDEHGFGKMYTGQLGVAMCYLKLHAQFEHLKLNQQLDIDFLEAAKKRIPHHQLPLDFVPGRPSPLMSPSLGAAFLRLLTTNPLSDDPDKLLLTLQQAIEYQRVFEFRDRKMGVDEAMFGRTGLLAYILQLYSMHFKDDLHESLVKLYHLVPQLLEKVIIFGEEGSQLYAKDSKSDAFPLMWSWIDNYYGLGGMHGMTGILIVLLNPSLPMLLIEYGGPEEESKLTKLYQAIATSITGLCHILLDNNGHFPMAIPDWPIKRDSLLVQICHGPPGLLLLLSAAAMNKSFTATYWTEVWDKAIDAGAEVVWKEGFLSKGAGFCHGIAGNAFPLLLLGHASGPSERKERLLGRALRMLLVAQEAIPFKKETPSQSRGYRPPDNPFSLFEGLSGTIWVWAEACAILEAEIQAHDSTDPSVTSISGKLFPIFPGF